jgi:hypothetical protein
MKKTLVFLLISCILFTISCNDDAPTAAQIVEKSMQAHGVDQMRYAQMDFKFRGIDYSVQRRGGEYVYERSFQQGSSRVVDQLSNTGFERRINDSIVQLADTVSTRYAAAVNSVIYFAQLPYGLDSDAVNFEHLGMDSIRDQNYHEIKVTFDEQGGGEDHEDEFVYWINSKDHMVDYLAYSYCEEDCGSRFRESVNRRNIQDIVVQDYHNYKSLQAGIELHEMDDLFEMDQLDQVSVIKTEFAEIELLEPQEMD